MIVLIEINNVTKTYKGRLLLENASISFYRNSINYLIGSNGSGKTTLIKCLLQLESYEGEILFDSKEFKSIQKQVGIVYDTSPFYPFLSGIANLKLLISQDKLDMEYVDELSEKLLIKNILNNKVKYYSYGEKKKLSLVLALLANPSYLILDEISNGLDYDSMELLKRLLPEWSKTMTIIVTGHHYEFYSTILDHLFIIKNKKIKEIHNLDQEIKELHVRD